MNSDVPSVPITTLAGIHSLTELLPELPLPTPTTSTSHNKTLLHNAKLKETSKRLLASQDAGLTQQLTTVLRKTSTENLDFKDSTSDGGIDGNPPELLKSILSQDPAIFQGRQYYGNGSQKDGYNLGSPHYQNNLLGGDPSKFQNPYGNYTPGIVNGEHPELTNQYPGYQGQGAGKSLGTISSPAPGSLAENSYHNEAENHSGVNSSYHRKKLNSEPVVLLEQLPNLPPRASGDASSTTSADSHGGEKKKIKSSHPVVLLEPLDEQTLKSIQHAGSVKAKDKKRGRRIYDSDDDYNDRHGKRRRYNSDSDDSSSQVARKKKKDKRHRRVNQQALSVEELLESPTFKKFSSSMEYILEASEDTNFGSLDPNDDEVECPTESLIANNLLTELSGETAKLKSLGVMNRVPADRLVKLLTILQWNIRDGTKVTPIANQGQDEDEEEQKLWRSLIMERVMRSMNSALIALHIMTSPDMPKQVYLEDVIERIILFGKFQLQNTIFPEFDPVYKIDPKAKDGYHGSLKAKRARATQVKHKSTINLFNKISDMIENLSELVDVQELTDTTILQLSTLGVSPFFVENISEMQLNSMKLVTTIFSKYEKHCQLILEDIFASLARLPSSKRNLRNYRLNSEESIQMVTALALQLIQCVIKLPSVSSQPDEEEIASTSSSTKKRSKTGQNSNDVVIVTSFENALRTGYNFLTVFLQKCTVKSEEDYRPMFENFVQDLLSTVNKPEWPSSELLLSLLGKILVKQFSNKSVDMSLRVASLDYLGIVASRLRKDAVSSHDNQESIDEIVTKVTSKDSDDEEGHDTAETSVSGSEAEDQTQILQKSMLDYLAYNSQSEPAYWYAHLFYIAQWYRDITVEAESLAKNSKHRTEEEEDKATEAIQKAEQKKTFLLAQFESINKNASYRPPVSKLDYEAACLVARYLSSKRPFAQSFDVYLTQILRVLNESAVAVRTKAMKCLTAVVEADPGILARADMQKGVHYRFLDSSTSVREAAVELVGRFILIRPELISQYYDMLSVRILDTGISVRKRVIKIFRDICLEHSDFQKIPEMCVKMIRRVNDEEGIKKLVNEVFQTMWFTPINSREKDTSKLLTRVLNITDVVAACRDTGFEFFEQMLENLLKKDEDGNINKNALTACRQIVDCLVENVLRLEEKSVDTETGKGCSQRLVACLSTLHLFSKIKPDLMVKHATTLQPYLDIKCSTQGDHFVLHYVARILEMVVPLMDHPSETFLAQLEEDMMKLILKHGMMVVESCISCLGAVVNLVSHNFPLVKDCFEKFFGVLVKLCSDHKENPDNPQLKSRKPTLLRSLFTVGLLCKYFDLDKEIPDIAPDETIRERVFQVLMYFINHEDEIVKEKALCGLGYMVIRHYDLMLGKEMRDLYYEYLDDSTAPDKLRIQVLKNLQNYLLEEEIRMHKADAEWRKHAKEEDLKEMGDIQSGMASTIMQVYLKHVLDSFFHSHSQVRLAALQVVVLVLQQGLVHPVQCVPYLISMCTDVEKAIRVKADQQLQEIDKKYPGFIHMKALQGLKMSYKLQQLLQSNSKGCVIRGVRDNEGNMISLNNFLYTVLRGNRSHRRAILLSLLNLFDDSAKISLAEQLYIADNLAFFPYQTQDEPLFIINQIDIIVSVSGSNILQSFRERLHLSKQEAPSMNMVVNAAGENRTENGVLPRPVIDDEDEDDPDKLMTKLPEDIRPLLDICYLAQGCILLLHLKHHLKETYGFSDSKIHNYSQTDAKTYDKPVQRKFIVTFNPETVIDILNNKTRNRTMKKRSRRSRKRNRHDSGEGTSDSSVSSEEEEEEEQNIDDREQRRKLVDDYLEFKDLMLSIDPPDEEEEGEENRSTGRQTPNPAHGQTTPGSKSPRLPNPDCTGEESMEMTVEVHEETSEKRVPPITIRATPHSHHTPKSSRHHHLFAPDKKKIPVHSSSSSSSKNLSKSFSKSLSSKKKPKKRRKRYGSDSEDDSADSDFVL
ncbi:nipped-B-like protein isoform X1 [Saccostrea echinata]|uniref:nipped-B-like protein isoform X1 n=1 Tax=Saccostrea echinata TaxID=191078 RepID=UPI002A82C6B5|nr:nipped-B-like protein isoform X1 [Saccostrea echinata]